MYTPQIGRSRPHVRICEGESRTAEQLDQSLSCKHHMNPTFPSTECGT
jgi:hypothetical protein